MTKPLITVQEVHKSYLAKRKVVNKAVQGISFDILEGEIFGLLGVNGAGKSTLSGILAGLHPPTSGGVLWKGASIYKKLLPYKRIVGFCPQMPNIDPDLSLSQALYLAARCYGKTDAGAKERSRDLIEKLDLGSYVDSVASTLSGGYKQRFLIARALAHSPQFVILDEPTVGLDPHIRKNLWSLIEGLRSDGVTIMLTTHYLEEAEHLSDRVCFIDHGEIIALGTPGELNKKYGKKSLEEVFLHLVETADKEGAE